MKKKMHNDKNVERKHGKGKPKQRNTHSIVAEWWYDKIFAYCWRKLIIYAKEILYSCGHTVNGNTGYWKQLELAGLVGDFYIPSLFRSCTNIAKHYWHALQRLKTQNEGSRDGVAVKISYHTSVQSLSLVPSMPIRQLTTTWISSSRLI